MDQIHTQITKPLSLRREILEGAVIATEALATCENVQKLLDAHSELRRQTLELCKTLQTETSVLERVLPPLPTEFIKTQRRIEPMRSEIKQNIPQMMQQPQKTRLEQEIEEIRKKLSSLQRQ